MKEVVTSVICLVIGAWSSGASALVLVDQTTFYSGGVDSGSILNGHGYGAVNKLDGTFDYVAWTHKFQLDAAANTITKGVLAISLKDDSRTDGIEIGVGFAESGQWDVGLVKTGTYAYNVAINSLKDGLFSVKVASLLGDFLIEKSVLRIDYVASPVTPVPEPATLSLLGLGLIGAALVARRRTKQIP